MTALAIAAAVLIGGVNVVGVRLSNKELQPFFGAGLRFAVAALVFLDALRRLTRRVRE